MSLSVCEHCLTNTLSAYWQHNKTMWCRIWMRVKYPSAEQSIVLFSGLWNCSILITRPKDRAHSQPFLWQKCARHEKDMFRVSKGVKWGKWWEKLKVSCDGKTEKVPLEGFWCFCVSWEVCKYETVCVTEKKSYSVLSIRVNGRVCVCLRES